jgi:hypothetical protein
VTTILAHFSPNRHQNIELTDFCLGISVEGFAANVHFFSEQPGAARLNGTPDLPTSAGQAEIRDG